MQLKHEPWPLDIAILKLLPLEGSMLGGVHHLGRRVKDISEALGEHVTSAQVNSRARICKENGLAVHKNATGGKVWQVTQKGVDLLVEMHEDGVAVPKQDVPQTTQSALSGEVAQ